MITYRSIEYYSVKEVAKDLSISTSRVLQLTKQGYFGDVMRGKQRILHIPKEAVIKYAKLFPTGDRLVPIQEK